MQTLKEILGPNPYDVRARETEVAIAEGHPPAEVTLFNPDNYFPWDMTLGSRIGTLSIEPDEDPWRIQLNKETCTESRAPRSDDSKGSALGALFEVKLLADILKVCSTNFIQFPGLFGFNLARRDATGQWDADPQLDRKHYIEKTGFQAAGTSLITGFAAGLALMPFGAGPAGVVAGALIGACYFAAAWYKGYRRGAALGEYEKSQQKDPADNP